jgi:hypothetical protein
MIGILLMLVTSGLASALAAMQYVNATNRRVRVPVRDVFEADVLEARNSDYLPRG